MVVETISPRTAHQSDEVVVALLVLGKHNEVVALVVALLLVFIFLMPRGYIHLTTEDGLKRREVLLATLLVHLVDGIEILFDAIHHAMVGDSHAAHAVVDGFLHQTGDARLTIEEAVVSVDVEMYEVVHNVLSIKR